MGRMERGHPQLMTINVWKDLGSIFVVKAVTSRPIELGESRSKSSQCSSSLCQVASPPKLTWAHKLIDQKHLTEEMLVYVSFELPKMLDPLDFWLCRCMSCGFKTQPCQGTKQRPMATHKYFLARQNKDQLTQNFSTQPSHTNPPNHIYSPSPTRTTLPPLLSPLISHSPKPKPSEARRAACWSPKRCVCPRSQRRLWRSPGTSDERRKRKRCRCFWFWMAQSVREVLGNAKQGAWMCLGMKGNAKTTNISADTSVSHKEIDSRLCSKDSLYQCSFTLQSQHHPSRTKETSPEFDK